VTPQRSVVLRLLQGAAGLAVVIATVVVSGFAVLAVWLGVGTGYDAPSTALGWMSAIADSANVLRGATTVLALSLAGICLLAVVAAVRRSLEWLVLSAVCAACLGLALVVVAGSNTEMDRLVERAMVAVGGESEVDTPVVPTPDPDSMTTGGIRSEIGYMLGASVDVADPPVLTQSGDPVAVDRIDVVSAPCGEVGARLSVDLSFTTGDNAASLERILAEWDRAGYLPDRAMNEDVRYSMTLPLARMSIRDTSTIDGLLHMRIDSACAEANR
jgi:hypothetical protein